MTELLNGFLSGSAAWGVMLTLAAFALGTLINRATGKAIFNPLLLGSIFVIILLSVLNIPYADYKASASPVNYLLLPATISLAIPLYEKWDLLKENAAAIIAGISVGTLVMAFLATAVYFGLMAVYGTTTHKDLTGWGPRLMMALVAMIVTSLVGALFGFGFGASVLYCGIGLVLFMLLTAYDSQKLQQMYAYYAGDPELAEKASIYGALTLYLDFINIFLYVVRLLGMNSRSRNN